jgi:hypothetical protein
MESLTHDGFVVTVHYSVNAEDTGITASMDGTIGYSQIEGKTYTPYAELTEAQVIGWVQNSVGKITVETSLQGQIDAFKNPVQEISLPWA